MLMNMGKQYLQLIFLKQSNCSLQKYKKPKFIQCFAFSLTGDVLTGDSEGNILTWGKSAADVKTLGKGAKGQCRISELSVLNVLSL